MNTQRIPAQLKEISNLLRGVTYKKQDSTDQPEKGYVPILRATNINQHLDFDNLVYVPEKAVSKIQYLKQGDIVIAASSGSRAVVGKTAQLHHEWKGSFGAFCYAIRPLAEHTDPKYIGFFLQTGEYRNRVSELAAGVNINNLKRQHLEEMEIPLFPLPEQHRIVEAIENYFSRLDKAVEALERVKANLKRYRASVLKSAVEGQLVPTEAELAKAEGRDYEPASVLLERILKERRKKWEEAGGRGKYKAPAAPDTDGLPELPEGWCWATVEQLIVFGPQNGVYVPKSKYGQGIPILRIDDYQNDWSRPSVELQKINIDENEASKYGLEIGDLVVNRVNSPSHLGKSVVIKGRNLPSVFESNMMRLTLSNTVSPEYVQAYLTSLDGKARLVENAKWAVNQASINQKDVGDTPIPLPPLTEQDRIVSETERLLSVNDDVDLAIETNLQRTTRLRQAILKWAFEGKLADQDPNDEPASELLERIRQEREGMKPGKKTGKRGRKG